MVLIADRRKTVVSRDLPDTEALARRYVLSLVTSPSQSKSSSVDPRELRQALQALLDEQFRAASAPIDASAEEVRHKAQQRRRVEDLTLRLTTSQSFEKTSVVDVEELKSALMAATQL